VWIQETVVPNTFILLLSSLIEGLQTDTHTWKGTNWTDDMHQGVPLKGSEDDVQTTVQDVEWLDMGACAVIVEFVMFSVDVNQFAVFHILFEFTLLRQTL